MLNEQKDYTAEVVSFMSGRGVNPEDGGWHYELFEAFKKSLGDRKQPKKSIFDAHIRRIYGGKRKLNQERWGAAGWQWEFPHWDEVKGAVPVPDIAASLAKDSEIARLNAEIAALKNEIAVLNGETS